MIFEQVTSTARIVNEVTMNWKCSLGRVTSKAYRILARKPAGKRPLQILTRRQENNIKKDLRKIGYKDRKYTKVT